MVGVVAAGETLDGKEGEILLHGESMVFRGFLAEIEKLPQFITKCGQGFVVLLGHGVLEKGGDDKT